MPHGGARRRRGRTGIWKPVWKDNKRNLPWFGEGNGQAQDAQGVPKKLDPKRATPRHTIIKMPKAEDKEKILKAAKGELQRSSRKTLADFSKGTLQARRGWKEVFQVMKGKDLHPRWLYPANLSFRMEGQMKCFPDEVKLKEFIITKPLLYEMLKGLI